MVKLIRLNGTPIVVNADLIETVESTPDTIVTLTTGKKMLIKDKIDEVIEKVVDYQKSVAGQLSIVDRRNDPAGPEE